VQDALPPGWSLLTNLHLLGVDDVPLASPQRGCKYEVDMLVLDDSGLGVAIIEGARVPWPCVCVCECWVCCGVFLWRVAVQACAVSVCKDAVVDAPTPPPPT
jgi:hypothetical protein